MAFVTKSPQNRTASSLIGERAPAERLALAMALCNERGVRMTSLRRQVMELLLERAYPTSAYELIEALKHKNARAVGPPTVYRALDFLTAQRLVAKVESRNAYVPCAYPESDHDCIFFICNDCGASIEMEAPRIEQHLTEGAAKTGFSVTRCMVEMQGTCARCISANSA